MATSKELWILSHCSCGGHVSKLKQSVRPYTNGKRILIKVGGSSDTTVSSGHRYYKVRQIVKEIGGTGNGSYGYLYNPETKAFTQIYRDDIKTRKERVLEVI